MKLLKMCVQNKYGLLFSFLFSSLIKIVRLMFCYKKCLFKVIGKQMKYKYEKCVFIIVLLMLYYKKYVFKASEKLLFSFLSYFCNMKNVCLKQAGGCFQFTQLLLKYEKNGGACFLVYSAALQVRKIRVQNKRSCFLVY